MLKSSNWKRPMWHALGPILTIVGVGLLALSPLGYRMGWFGISVALLRLIPLGVIACGLGLVASLAAMMRTPAGAGPSAWIVPVVAIVVCIAVAIVPIAGIAHARQVPSIHDITTDTEMPPVFVALAADRSVAPNGMDYGGAEVAAAQKRGYPDLTTMVSKLTPDALFDRAQQAAQQCGWRLADADRKDLRIEAVDTSVLYGFKDDIVVRIRADAGGSRMDVRSASRVGRSDLGVNAARIRRYLQRLTQMQSG